MKKIYFGSKSKQQLNITKRPPNWHRYQKVLKECEILDRDKQAELAIAAQSGCERSKEKLARSCMRLVVSVANYYHKAKIFGTSNAMDLADIVQEGNLGLVNAIARYKNYHNCSFASYAVLNIRWYILSSIRKVSMIRRPIRLPEEEFNQNGTFNKPEDLNVILLTEPDIKSEEGETYEETIASDLSADEELIVESFYRDVDRTLGERNGISVRGREIIKLFFGIGTQSLQLEDIGEQLGITRERIRQLRNKAITALRRGEKRNGDRGAPLLIDYNGVDFVRHQTSPEDYDSPPPPPRTVFSPSEMSERETALAIHMQKMGRELEAKHKKEEAVAQKALKVIQKEEAERRKAIQKEEAEKRRKEELIRIEEKAQRAIRASIHMKEVYKEKAKLRVERLSLLFKEPGDLSDNLYVSIYEWKIAIEKCNPAVCGEDIFYELQLGENGILRRMKMRIEAAYSGWAYNHDELMKMFIGIQYTIIIKLNGYSQPCIREFVKENNTVIGHFVKLNYKPQLFYVKEEVMLQVGNTNFTTLNYKVIEPDGRVGYIPPMSITSIQKYTQKIASNYPINKNS